MKKWYRPTFSRFYAGIHEFLQIKETANMIELRDARDENYSPVRWKKGVRSIFESREEAKAHLIAEGENQIAIAEKQLAEMRERLEEAKKL